MSAETKLISHTFVDFSSEAEMEIYLAFFEEKGPALFEKLNKCGLNRWRVSRVWNKEGKFSVSLLYEYQDEKAFKQCRELNDKFVEENAEFYRKVTLKRNAYRTINIFDFGG